MVFGILAAAIFVFATAGGCKPRGVLEDSRYMEAAPQYWVRVLLLNDVNSCRVSVESAFDIEHEGAQGSANGAQHRAGGVDADVSVEEGRLVLGAETFANPQVVIAPNEPHIFALDGRKYRGRLELRPGADANSFDAINHVPLEAYLAGVVGAEMPSYWEGEALKAQAIAARTYCLHIKKRFGGGRHWDVTATAANQMYLGVRAESRQVHRAVKATAGQVLVCKQNGDDEIFPAYYSSSCGGHTEDSKNVFGDSYPPLAGVACPYCKEVARAKFFYWPMVRIRKAALQRRLFARYPVLAKLSKITQIVIERQSDYGDFSRATKITIVGPNEQSDWLRAEDFRLAADPTGARLRSTSFRIEDGEDEWVFLSGRGYGHAVGLCQCGAEAMARRGKNATEILFFYYPGARVKKIYPPSRAQGYTDFD